MFRMDESRVSSHCFSKALDNGRTRQPHLSFHTKLHTNKNVPVGLLTSWNSVGDLGDTNGHHFDIVSIVLVAGRLLVRRRQLDMLGHG